MRPRLRESSCFWKLAALLELCHLYTKDAHIVAANSYLVVVKLAMCCIIKHGQANGLCRNHQAVAGLQAAKHVAVHCVGNVRTVTLDPVL